MFKGYGYKGRHRAKQSYTGRIATASVGAAFLSIFGAQGVASADTLDAIAQCESSGNPTASNGTHFGLYQFDMSTWRSVGGSGSPLNASPAEQTRRAQMLLAQRGTQPWLASQSCWAGKTTNAKVYKPRHAAPPKAKKVIKKPVTTTISRAAPAPTMNPKPKYTGLVHIVRSGETLSGISVELHVDGGWKALYNKNHAVVGGNANLIYPGEKLAL